MAQRVKPRGRPARRLLAAGIFGVLAGAPSALAGCGVAAPTALPVAAPSARGAVAAKGLPGSILPDGWHGVLLPTMQTLSVPVLDFASPLAAWRASSYVWGHQAAYETALSAERPAVAMRIAALRQVCDGNSLAEAAFVRLAISGKLAAVDPGAPAGTPSLLDSLEAIAFGPVAQDLDRVRLLHQLLAELDVPGRICQGIKLTCEATSVQIMLDLRSPAEYAHLIAGLASPAGTATLADGETIARVPDWDSGTDGWRSMPSRLIQPAFAVLGNAPLTYSNTQDRNSLGQSGLTDAQVARLCGAVLGRPFRFLAPAASSNADRMAAFRGALSRGWQVPVWLDWFSGHVVLAEADAQGRVEFDNPLGAIHSVTDAVFEQRLHSVYVPVSP